VSGNGGMYLGTHVILIANGFLVHRPGGDVEFVIRKAICQDQVRTILQSIICGYQVSVYLNGHVIWVQRVL